MTSRNNTIPQGEAPASNRRSKGSVIDVHHHLLPPKYIAAVRETLLRLSVTPRVLDWTPASSLEDMDESGVRTAIVSISAPGVWLDNVDVSRRVARECNEFAAKMAVDHPGRFGFFAALPLPDTEGSLMEIEYALDVLHASGVGLLSSYNDKYLGDPAFTPVFDELNRRNAIVYCHPTAANCCQNIAPDIPVSMEEFAFDTTRTITSLLYGGTFSRCSNIKFIFSHGGGTVPFLAGRIGMFVNFKEAWAARLPEGPGHELRKLHFDTASVTNAPAMAAILKLIPATQLMFGSDFPWGRAGSALNELRNLGLRKSDVRSVESTNASRLFPGLTI